MKEFVRKTLILFFFINQLFFINQFPYIKFLNFTAYTTMNAFNSDPLSLDKGDYNDVLDEKIALIKQMPEARNFAKTDTKSDHHESNELVSTSKPSGNEMIKITLSAAGDCTLGTDESFPYAGSFNAEFNKRKYDYGYFLGGVKSVFSKDDITIVNLETTLTLATARAQKTFRFKGDPSYVEILKAGSVEAVNISNNHIHDYLDKGFKDTVENLKRAKLGFFGENNKYTQSVKGIKIGFLGYQGWTNSSSFKQKIKKDIDEMKKSCGLVVVSFHWGVERQYYPNGVQKDLAHFCIDNGADLILGHHPHVIQGIEKYKNKYIAYSLGNFCFGGNRNPSDKDTYIFQQSFNFDISGNLLSSSDKTVIPCSISSVGSRNDYRPTILQGAAKERVLKRLQTYSSKFN